MCGIVSYYGTRPALPLLLEGLRRVEYRGYDSSGIALLQTDGSILVKKRCGKIAALEQLLGDVTAASTVGIAHTRWATHGAPSDVNAHPHLSQDGTIAVVHNGTVENFFELKSMLEAAGYRMRSDTDTEIIAHLIEKFCSVGDNLVAAVQKAHALLKGAYGIAVVSGREPGRLVVARHGSPLVMGLADHGYFFASDATAFREHTDKVIYLDDGEMVAVDTDGYRVLTLTNSQVAKDVQRLEWNLEQIAKGGYPHFMLKEIMEQPATVRAALAGRLTAADDPSVHLGGMPKIEPFVRATLDGIVITACGTSWHSGLIGKRVLEKLLRLPVMVEYASEFATGHTPVGASTLCITITQSGETKDTIEAAKRAKAAGAIVWNICNVVGSSMTRLADSGVYLHAGPEIGVASTKAFTSQIVALILTTLKIVELRSVPWVSADDRTKIAHALLALPDQISSVLGDSDHVLDIARSYADHRNFLYLGRGYNYPTALEGALKLKEISYVHAEGYPAGEMKHGPIALIDEEMPVVVIAPTDSENEMTYNKVLSNVEEVASRGGKVILIATEGDPMPERLRARGKVERILYIPQTIAMCTPILASIYLQLLAYHIAALRGCPIDQPRNLAKSVTVE